MRDLLVLDSNIVQSEDLGGSNPLCSTRVNQADLFVLTQMVSPFTFDGEAVGVNTRPKIVTPSIPKKTAVPSD
jgi:hypothetical protein